MKFSRVALCLGGTLLLAACSMAGASSPGSKMNSDTAIPNNAVVLSGHQLITSGGMTLLEAMRGRVMNLAVERRTSCPHVTLRGEKTIIGSSNPLIYVDGARVADTCVLEQIRVYEVKRVEIYPHGITQRPGYGSSPFGLILVFLTDGAS